MVYENTAALPRQELTDVVTESMTTNGMFIGDLILPSYPLKLKNAHYTKVTVSAAELMRATTSKRAPGAGFDRWQAAMSDGSIALTQYGEEIPIPDEQTDIYDSYFAFESFFSMETGNRLKRLNEILIAAQINNTGNFDAVASAVAYTVALTATNSFISDVIDAITRVNARGELANTIAMSWNVYNRVRQATLVKNFIVGINGVGSEVTVNTLQRAFADMGITQVLIGRAYVNQAASGATPSLAAIWNDTYVYVGNCQTGQLQGGGIGRNFYWEKTGGLYALKSYRDEPKASNVIRGESTPAPTIVNTRAGTLITTQYS